MWMSIGKGQNWIRDMTFGVLMADLQGGTEQVHLRGRPFVVAASALGVAATPASRLINIALRKLEHHCFY